MIIESICQTINNDILVKLVDKDKYYKLGICIANKTLLLFRVNDVIISQNTHKEDFEYILDKLLQYGTDERVLKLMYKYFDEVGIKVQTSTYNHI